MELDLLMKTYGNIRFIGVRTSGSDILLEFFVSGRLLTTPVIPASKVSNVSRSITLLPIHAVREDFTTLIIR